MIGVIIVKRIKCPCCGNYTIESDDEVIVDICEVCYWQYDAVAHDYPQKCIGPNHVSLNEAKENYKKFGACEKRFVGFVRKPSQYEISDNNLYSDTNELCP